MDLGEEVKRGLSRTHSIGQVKDDLVKRGYLEEDIEKAISRLTMPNEAEKSRNNNIFTLKELLDRIAYGFSSQPFVNILFMLSGASLFVIGFFNGFKTVLTYLLSGFLKELSKIKYIGKGIISTSGIVYGFSFLGMAFAVVLKSPVLFIVSLLAGTLGIIAHGDLYIEFLNETLKNEKRKNFLRFISYFGIIITAVAMLGAGFLMEWFPLAGKTISFGLENLAAPVTFTIYGYLVAFEITAILFIISGYILSFIEEKKDTFSNVNAGSFSAFTFYIRNSVASSKIFRKNSKIFLLLVATVLTTVIQVLGNSYYGIFIYAHFKDQFLKGFMNVAVIFVIALIASISGTIFTRRFSKSLGEAPMLVFGILLVALLPLTLYYNPTLYSIGLAVALSVIGGAIVGVAQGLLAERLMNEQELKTYFSTLGFISIIPTLLLVFVGALVAQLLEIQTLFLILGIVLALVIMPLYFVIVLIVEKEYRAMRRT